MIANVVVQPAADDVGAGLDFIEFFTGGFSNPVATPTGTSFVLHDTTDGFDLVFAGTGLTYSAGKITGGTITGFDIVSDDIHATIAKVTGLDLDAPALYTAAKSSDSAALDALFTDAYSFNFVGGGGDDVLSSGRFDFETRQYTGKLGSTIFGGAGDDRLQGGSGDDVIEGGAGADQINGGSGHDTLSYAHDTQGISVTLIDSASGNASGFGGDAQGDLIIGAFANAIGGSGDDRIIVSPSGSGIDHTIEGGAGADVLAGSGFDTVSYEHSTGAVTVSLATQGVIHDVDIGGGVHLFFPDLNSPGAAQHGGDAEGDLLWGFENARGGSGDDVIAGDANDNVIEGGAGADTLSGGGGNDTVSYQHSTVGVTVDLGVQDGSTAQSSPGTDADGDILSGFANIIGSSGSDTLTGDSNDNVIEGGAGADMLFGGGGADTVSYAHDTVGVTVDLGHSIVSGGDAQGDFLSGFINILGGAGNDVLTGDGSDNVIDGGAGDDTLSGGAGADTLIGGTGFNTVSYANAAGAATVDLSAQMAADDGDGGTDTLSDIASVVGSSHDDILTGSAGITVHGEFTDTILAPVLFGGAGDDTLLAGGDNNVLHGGAGADTFIGAGFHGTVASYSDAIVGVTVNLVTTGSGIAEGDSFINIPLIEGSAFDDTIIAGSQSVTLTGGAGNDTLVGGSGDDTVIGGTGADTLDGGAGIDTLDYSAAQPKFDPNGIGPLSALLIGPGFGSLPGVTVTLGEGDAVTTASGVGTDAAGDKISHFENIIGALGGNNVLTGNSAANTLTGQDGTDILKGMGGDDTLIAGTDNVSGDADTLDGGDGNDLFISNGGDKVTGGNGIDTITFQTFGGGVTLTLGKNGTTTGYFVDGGNINNETITGVENILGTTSDDTFSGAVDPGINVIEGGAGNDRLIGGAGDIVSYAHSATSVFVDLGAQDGTIAQAATHDFGAGDVANGDAAGDVLSGFGSIIGSAHDDTIVGGVGNDTIEGGAGADTLTGHGGVDAVSYAHSTLGVTVDLTIQNGMDAQAIQLGTDASGDVLSGFTNLVGGTGDDVLIGNASANIIQGGLGDDTIAGGGGNDTLDGGVGIDTVDYSVATGGTGITVTLGANGALATTTGFSADKITNFENVIGTANADKITGNAFSNVIEGSAGADTLDGGAGIDTLSYQHSAAPVAVTLSNTAGAAATVSGGDAAGDVAKNFENVIGTVGADAITGNTASNIIEGGAGADTLSGGGGAGIDTVSYAHSASGVTVDLALQGVGPQVSQANDDADGDVLSGFRNVIGSAHNDELTGDASANAISGGAGDDEIYGGLGADAMDGGDGIDTLAYGAIAVENITVNLTLNAVKSNASGLQASGDTIKNFENVDYSDTGGNNTAIGTSGNNALTGGLGADTLNGGAGDDILIGNQGNDTLIGGVGNDLLQGGTSSSDFSGSDTADYSASVGGISIALNTSGVTFGHGGDAEGDSLYGMSGVIGGAGNDILRGDTTNDVLTKLAGGLGDDVISAGGSGHDVLDGGGTAAKPGSDTLDYSVFGGSPSISLTLGAAGVTTTTSGFHTDTISNFENVIGTAGDDTITGNAGANIINGAGGNDTLDGAAGIDTVSFENSIDGVSLTLGAFNASTKAVAGSAAIVGMIGFGETIDQVSNFENVTGTTHDDHITGNAAANIIKGLDGTDTLDGGAGDDRLEGGAGFDILTGGAGKDFMDGGDGTDAASYAGDTVGVTITLGAGGGTTGFKAAGGNAIGDTLINIENIVGSDGNDVLTGNEKDNFFDAAAGNDVLAGGAGNDFLSGGAGNDTLDGGAGNDTLYGGAGDDLLTGGAGNDMFLGADIFAQDVGKDTVSYAASAAGVTVSLASNGTIFFMFPGIPGTLNNDAVAQHGGDAEGDLFYGIDNVIGSAKNDIISGFSTGSATSLLDGGAGDDLIVVSAGGGSYFGGAGNDTISFANVTSANQITIALGQQGTANAARTVIVGGGNGDGEIAGPSEGTHFSAAEFENVIGSAASDSISGDGKNNIIEGGGGNDTLSGNGGTDTVSYASSTLRVEVDLNKTTQDTDFNHNASDGSNNDAAGDVLNGFTNITGGAGDDHLIGNGGNNILQGGAGGDVLEGGIGDDTLMGGAGDDSFNGGAGKDTIDGGDGNNDTLSYGGVAGVTITLGKDGTLTGFSASGGDAAGDKITNVEQILGTEQNDVLDGHNYLNISVSLLGNGGNDTITGGVKNDDLVGGGGDDTIQGGAGANSMEGDLGTDTVSYASSASGVTVNLSQQGGEGIDSADRSDPGAAQQGGDAAGDLLWGFENITGSAKNDTLTGDEGANAINGGLGDDLIEGGAGADKLTGGGGNDTVTYAHSASSVSVDLSVATQSATVTGIDGNDLVGPNGDAASDVLNGFVNLVGSAFSDILKGTIGANNIQGGDGNDTISGGAGNDALDGGAGNDSVDGGAGNDTITAGDGNDIDTIIGGDGIDTLTYANSSHAVTVDLSNTGAQDTGGTASSGTDTISGIEILIGSDVGDTLTGGAGNDTLIGGDGADMLFGGAGNDTLLGGNDGDYLQGDAGTNVIDGGDGGDTVGYRAANAAVTVDLTKGTATGGTGAGKISDKISNVENVSGSDHNDVITGSAVDNVLLGGDGDDTISGGTGNDTIWGQGGNDTLIGGAGADMIVGGDLKTGIDTGSDTASYATSATGVTVDLRINDGSTDQDDSQASDASGDILFGIENVTGSAKNDVLTGDDGANRIDGGAGNDQIEGGAGADTLIGGAGTDTVGYTGDTAGVIVDLNLATAQHGGDAEGDILSLFENLAGGSGNDTLSGTSAANVIMGDTGDDVIEGRAGADTLDAGDGNDTLSYAHSAAAVNVKLNDSGKATVSGGDAAGDNAINFENILGSTKADKLTGNGDDNVIEGGAGADTLDGSGGSDTLSYASSAAAVTVTLVGEGAATVSGGDAAGDNATNFENIRGSANADNLTGNSSSNVIEGGAGADILDGGQGNDTLSYEHSSAGVSVALGVQSGGGSGTTPVVLTGSGGDAEGDSTIHFENLTGSAFADTLVGNSGNNVISGGDGNDGLSGGTGNDVFNGGDGLDVVTYKSSNAMFNYNTDGVTIDLAAGTVDHHGGANHDTLSSIEIVIGSSHADSFDATGFSGTSDNAGSGNIGNEAGGFNIFRGGGGDDDITGNGLTRVQYTDAAGASGGTGDMGVIVNLDTNTHTVTFEGNTITDFSGQTAQGIVSAQGIDVDTFHGGITQVQGSDHDDILIGSDNGSGAEVFFGGAGNDYIDGLGGHDRADYSNAAVTGADGIAVDLANGVVDGVTAAATTAVGTDTLLGIDQIRGTEADDTYDATGFSTSSTNAGDGDDFNDFEGAGGNDTVTGNGNTRISFTHADAGVTVDLGAGTADGADTGHDTIVDGVNAVRGSEFKDVITGDANGNILDGWLGNDVLTGGGGADTFVYSIGNQGGDRQGGGADLITDYTVGSDTIDLSGVDSVSQFSDLSMAQKGQSVVIDFGDGNTLTIAHTTIDTLTNHSGDFLFH